MKKTIMILAAAVLAVSVNAQITPSAPTQDKGKTDPGKTDHPGNHPGKGHDATERATRLTEFMTKKLLLTENQKRDVFNINLSKAKKIEALHAQKGKDKKALGAQRKAIEQERDAEFKRVLSVEQYDKWMKLKAEKKKNKKDKHEKGKDKSGKGKIENDKEDDSDDGDAVDAMEGRG